MFWIVSNFFILYNLWVIKSFVVWFFFGFWFFSILGWFKKIYDFEILFFMIVFEIGWDIFFFWIVCMIMLGLKMIGKIFFSEVFCYSLVCDFEGCKMFKSLGNVIDFLDVIFGIEFEKLYLKFQFGNFYFSEVQKVIKYQKIVFFDGIFQCGVDVFWFIMINVIIGGGDINFDVKV